MNRTFLFLLLVGLLFSCDKEEKEAALVAEAVDLKKNIYKEELLRNCMVNLFEEADKIVDSLILEKNDIKNVLEKPERPDRPEQPVVDYVDTIEIKKN